LTLPINHFKRDKFAELCGIELLEVKTGYARAKMDIKPCHKNSLDFAHGAAMFALADFVFAVASNSYETIAVGINTSMSFVKAVKDGTIFAVANEKSVNPKIAVYEVIITDNDGDTVGIFQGMVYRKKDSIYIYD